MATSNIEAPITGVCIVGNIHQCPPGYELLLKSQDKQDDCDLWKSDGLFKSKTVRYLCFTRSPTGSMNNILADISVYNERDIPPTGYTLLERTIDTSEKAMRKKQIGVKFVPSDGATNAISSLIILSKTRRPPAGYTLVGELNGLHLCYKMVTLSANNPSRDNKTTPLQPITNTPRRAPPSVPAKPVNGTYANNASPSPVFAIRRQDSVLLPNNPLSGIQFRTSFHLSEVENYKSPLKLPDVSFRSMADIENEYAYPFRIERSAAERLPSK